MALEEGTCVLRTSSEWFKLGSNEEEVTELQIATWVESKKAFNDY